MDTIGWIVVDGMPETPQFGIGMSTIFAYIMLCQKYVSILLASTSPALSVDAENGNIENEQNVAGLSSSITEAGSSTSNSEAGPSTSISEKQLEVASRKDVKREKKTVISCLKEIISKNEKKDDLTDILQTINSNLERLTEIESKKLKLRQLELQVKYPEVTFILDSDED